MAILVHNSAQNYIKEGSHRAKKSRIWDTQNLSTKADRSTNFLLLKKEEEKIQSGMTPLF